MIYNDVGLLISTLVFTGIIFFYRTTIFLAAHSRRFTLFIKGKPVYLIQDGKFCKETFRHQPLAVDEFFTELRLQGVSQLGQVRIAIFETSGEVSLFFFADEEAQYGLPIQPMLTSQSYKQRTNEDFYACVKCAESPCLAPGEHQCTCGNNQWAKASNERRVILTSKLRSLRLLFLFRLYYG